MFPFQPRAVSAAFVITTSIALAGCATSTDFFDAEEGAEEDDGSTGGAGGGGATTGPTSTTSSTGGTGGAGGTTTSTGGAGGSGGSGGSPVDTSGETCSDAADLNAAPLSLSGTYTDSVSNGGSCDPTADNIAWFTYTPAVSGLYDLSFTNNASTSAFSRVAIFEGSSCSSLGAEVACDMASSAQIETLALLEAGTTYTMMFYTDGPGYPMVSPTANINVTMSGPGSICELAEDLTTATFPFTMSGTFAEDPPTLGSCTSSANNVAWFSFTAPTSDTYLIEAENQTSTYAYSRIIVFESDACSPYGAEVACDTNSSTTIETEVDMVAGQDYLIAFHTDGDSYTMVNPVLNVGVKPPPPPGGECDSAVDVTAQALPYTQVGLFEDDPTNVSPSCATTPTNAAWFSYQPTTSDWYDLTLVNNTLDSSYSRVAIFEGTSCSPPGAELYCGTASSTTMTTDSVYLTAGVTYTVLFYTDGDSWGMEDPSIDVAIGTAPPPPPPGGECDSAVDVTSQALPYTQVGLFEDDPSNVSPSCDTTPTNAAWFSYQPTTSDWYDLTLINNTLDIAYSRVAIFEGTSCSPPGAELYCGTEDSTTITTSVYLTAGVTYTVLFYTDGDLWAMEDPSIDVAIGTPPPPGSTCGMPADLSAASFPHSSTGTFDDDVTVGSTCDSDPTNVVWYTYTPTVTQAYDISAVNNTTTIAFSRLAVFEGTTCNPLGTEVTCTTNAATTASLTGVTLTAGVTYLIAFYTDGNLYTMVDPEITITP